MGSEGANTNPQFCPQGCVTRAWILFEPVLREAKQEGRLRYLALCGQSQIPTLPLPWASLTQLFLFPLLSSGGFLTIRAETALMICANEGCSVSRRA